MTNNTKQFVKSFWTAWNSHDWEKTSPFYTDDCTMEDLPSKICHGKQEIEAYYRYLFVGYPDLNFEPKRSFGNGDHIASEWIMSGTHTGDTAKFKATGKKFSIQGVTILEINNGKIVRETDFWNMHSLLQQLGIVPPLG